MNKQLHFSLKSGFLTFIKSNLLLVLVFLVFIVNMDELRYVFIIIFLLVAESFIVVLSFVACFKKKIRKKVKVKEKKNKTEWLGFGITIILLSLFSLIFLGANIPYPSTLIFLMLMTNFMVSLYSIVFHPVALAIYEANVFQEKTTMLDYIFKYIAIFFSGINYYVQMILLNLPLLLNKLIAIVFVLFLLWQGFGVIAIFDR